MSLRNKAVPDVVVVPEYQSLEFNEGDNDTHSSVHGGEEERGGVSGGGRGRGRGSKI